MAERRNPADSRIFISYRRDDSIAHVNGLFPPLREHFGKERVFKDTDNIPPGKDFRKIIERELRSCSVLLTVIGRNWAAALKPKSTLRRLDDPNDYLRVEVATALKNEGVLVIPVLVGEAAMPAVEELPEELAQLAYLHAFELRDSRWESDVRLLIEAIERGGLESSAPPPPPPVTEPSEKAAPLTDQPDEDLGPLKLRRSRQIAEYMTSAQTAFAAQDHVRALEACEKVIWLDPQHGEARSLRRRARAALDERKIGAWLAQAAEIMERGEIPDDELAEVSGLLDQALALNPGHITALQHRHALLSLRKQRERQREIDQQVQAILVRARTSIEEESFDAAIACCDDALALASATEEAHTLRTAAVAAKAEQHRRRELKRQMQKLADQARAQFAGGQHEAAIASLEASGEPHELVTEALADLRGRFQAILKAREEEARAAAEQERRVRAGRVEQLLTAARSALEAQQFADAEGSLRAADELARQSPCLEVLLSEIADVRESVETAQAERANAAAAALAQAFDRSDYESAIRGADEALVFDPAEHDAQLLKERATVALEAQRTAAAGEQRARQEKRRRRLGERRGRGARQLVARQEADDRRCRAEAEARAAEEARKVRTERIEELLTSAQSSLETQQFATAHATLEDADALAHESPLLEDVIDRIAAVRADVDAREALQLKERANAAREEQRERAARELKAEAQPPLETDRPVAAAIPEVAPVPAATVAVPILAPRRYTAATAASVLAVVLALGGIGYWALQSNRESVTSDEATQVPPSTRPEILVEAPPGPPAKTAPSGTVNEPATSKSAGTESKTALDPDAAEQLSQLRDRMTRQYQAGQRVQALETAVAGLALDRNDPELHRMLTTLDADAQAAVRLAKQNAAKANAASRAAGQLKLGAQKESDAASLRKANRADEAIRSLWAAAESYSRAAQRAKQVGAQLDALASRARTQAQSGQGPQALDSALEGLKIDSSFSPLHEVLDSLWRDAQTVALRSKRQATDRGTFATTSPEFAEALRRESEAARLREARNMGDAVRSLWTASDLFAKAAERPADSKLGAPAGPSEEEQVLKVLNAYQAAYERLDAAAVKRVYPSVDQAGLVKAFGYYRSLSMAINNPRIEVSGSGADVSCTIVIRIQPRAGGTSEQTSTQPTTLRLRKSGGSWIITERR
jgi:hypothetical protein